MWPVRPAKTQISLGIRPVWSESSLCDQLVAKDPSFLHAQADLSLRWVDSHFVGFILRQLIYWQSTTEQLALKPNMPLKSNIISAM